MRLTHMDVVADRHGFVAVFPDGVGRAWADGRGTSADREHVNDVAFVSALVEHLSTTLPVDPKRIFACGISNGGFMAARLGCELSRQIAAIGVVAATFGTDTAASCRPSRPVSAMIIHGTDDPLVPASGGRTRGGGAEGGILSVDESVQRWAQLDGCTSPPTISDVPGSGSDGTRTRREIRAGCHAGAEVELMRIEGGGHTWPGGEPYLPATIIGVTSRTFDASEELWEFFSRHPQE
jgi:polyhydroxybutyrate depolymerase